MNPVIILDSRGKVLYCPEWPEEPECKVHCDVMGCEDYRSGNGFCICKKYEKDYEQAIANGIEFKDQEEIKKLVIGNMPPRGASEMESLKPYPVPYGIEIEVIGNSSSPIPFAVIKHRTKVYSFADFIANKLPALNSIANQMFEERPKDETQDAKNKMIKDITQKFYGARADAGDSSLSLISDFEIWLINYMEEFRIERIK